MKFIWHYETPIGRLGIAEANGAVFHLLFDGNDDLLGCERAESQALKTASRQLAEYFDGKRTCFDFPLSLNGTAFQRSAWQALQTIPFGETRSYKDVAIQIGSPKAARAVGMANNRNPIPIVIPCHRVVGSNGSLVGFAGGLGVKQYLLDLERHHVQKGLF
jgi:O-6-methylguanine DNA methyltransferase